MGIVGFFIGGAANIISAAICADMGRMKELRGNAEALATVTGIVDGTGSVGAGKRRCKMLRSMWREMWGAVVMMRFMIRGTRTGVPYLL